ncbi:MAG: hypothetical protein AABZ31_03315, partial [Bdellovibrionota bacterium]
MLIKWTSRAAAILVIAGVMVSEQAYSAKIEKAKGKKVLVNSEGDTLEVGQIYTVQNDSGKAVGIIKITKVGRNRAVAILGKGS